MAEVKQEVTTTTPAIKFDTGKPDFSLIPPECLEELAKLYSKGAIKYAPNNWRKGMDWGRVYAAMQRHANAWQRGEQFDPEDGQPHLASVAWCAFTLLWYEMYGVGKDDRYIAAKELGSK